MGPLVCYVNILTSLLECEHITETPRRMLAATLFPTLPAANDICLRIAKVEEISIEMARS
jgi:hypothetical protein